jgi:hypothetical protein
VGFVSINAIARELSEQEIPTAQGGKWHPTGVKGLLQRLEGLDCVSDNQNHRQGRFSAREIDLALG